MDLIIYDKTFSLKIIKNICLIKVVIIHKITLTRRITFYFILFFVLKRKKKKADT